jgi:uncharacterized protein (DUF1800 family)
MHDTQMNWLAAHLLCARKLGLLPAAAAKHQHHDARATETQQKERHHIKVPTRAAAAASSGHCCCMAHTNKEGQTKREHSKALMHPK